MTEENHDNSPEENDNSKDLDPFWALAPDPVPTKSSEFHMGDFSLILLGYFLISVFASASMMPAKGVKIDPVWDSWLKLGVTFFANCGAIGMFFYLGKQSKQKTWAELGIVFPSWKEWFRWIGITLSATFVFNLLYSLFLEKVLKVGLPKQDISELFSPSNPSSLIAFAIFSVVIMAPLAEEVVFRGVLFPACKNFLQSRLNPKQTVVLSALLSGLFFGWIHFNFKTILPLAFLGFLFALSYEKTKSLLLVMFLHLLNNSFALFLVLSGITQPKP